MTKVLTQAGQLYEYEGETRDGRISFWTDYGLMFAPKSQVLVVED